MNLQHFITDNPYLLDLGALYTCIIENKTIIPKDMIDEFEDKFQEYVFYNKEIVVPTFKFEYNNIDTIKKLYSDTFNVKKQNHRFDYFYFNTETRKENFTAKHWAEFQAFITNLETAATPIQKNKEKDNCRPEIIDNSENWWYYNFDIYYYKQPHKIAINLEDEFFQYFLIWHIFLVAPVKLNNQFFRTFFDNKSIIEVEDFFKKLVMTYPDLSSKIDWNERVRFILSTYDIDNKEVEKLNAEIEDSNKKPKGRPKKDYFISRPIERQKNDRLTCLDRKETSLLFFLLLKEKIILNDSNILSISDLAKLLSCLTGYSNIQLIKDISEQSYLRNSIKENKEIFIKLKEKFSEFNSIIDRHL